MKATGRTIFVAGRQLARRLSDVKPPGKTYFTCSTPIFVPPGKGSKTEFQQLPHGVGLNGKFDADKPSEARPGTVMHMSSAGKIDDHIEKWFAPEALPQDALGALPLKEGARNYTYKDQVVYMGGTTHIVLKEVRRRTGPLTLKDKFPDPLHLSQWGGRAIFHGCLSYRAYEARKLHAGQYLRANPVYQRHPGHEAGATWQQQSERSVDCVKFLKSEVKALVDGGHLVATQPDALQVFLDQQTYGVSTDVMDRLLLAAGLHAPAADHFTPAEINALHAKGVTVSPHLCPDDFEPLAIHANLWITKAELDACVAQVRHQQAMDRQAAGVS